MKNAFRYLTVAALLAASLRFSLAADAVSAKNGGESENPLIDVLVEQGVLTKAEGDRTKEKLAQQQEQSSASKIEIGSFISKLKLFGDARLRTQWQNAQSYNTTGTVENNDNTQYRLRLRLGAEYTYDPHWSAVVRLETATGNDTSNTNFGNYWDKTANTVYVGQVYLRYQDKFSVFDGTSTVADGKNYKTVEQPGTDVGVDVVVGRGPKQITLSDAFWDDDLNPDGLAEQFTFSNVGVDGLSFAARGAEYILSDSNGGTTAGGVQPGVPAGAKNESAYLFIAQLEGKYAFAPKANIIVSPLFLTETTGAWSGVSVTPGQTGNTYTSTGTNLAVLGSLEVVALPLEINWKLWNLPNKFYGTYGANLAANDRLHRLENGAGVALPASYANLRGNNTFWNVGYRLGELKKKGDWQASIEYRWIEALSYTPNLSDSDWASGLLNQQGVAVKAGYNLTDFLTINGVYYHSNPINPTGSNTLANSVTTGGTTGSVNSLLGTREGQNDTIQGELVWKF